MKVISLGTDRKIFEEKSAVRQRAFKYGRIFEELHVVVFTTRIINYESRIKIAENVWAYPTNSKSKSLYIWDALKISKRIIHNSHSINHNNIVISIQDPFETGLVGLLLKLIYKLPLQIQIHTDFANRYFIMHSVLNFIRFPLGLFVLSFADSVRVVSDRVAKSIHSLSHNVSVLPVYTVSQGETFKKVPKVSPWGINFLTVCRLEKEKDLSTAIKAFKIVCQKFPEATFVIVGDGSERKSLELLAKSLRIEEKVVFAGWQNNLEEYYKNADIYVSTSLYEGYGMSMVEAASCALPLVISDTGVAGSLFNDGEEAFVCKQKDVKAFAKAMSELAADGSLRNKMGALAKESARANGINFEQYLSQYKDSMVNALNFRNENHGIFKTNILLRYLVAGITATSTQIGLLYLFTDTIGFHYLRSSIIAFVVAIVISFTLQKFWTFRDSETKKIHHQFIKYAIIALLGLAANTLSMFLLVDILKVFYILAQIITGGLIMIFNFLMYKFFIFNK